MSSDVEMMSLDVERSSNEDLECLMVFKCGPSMSNVLQILFLDVLRPSKKVGPCQVTFK